MTTPRIEEILEENRVIVHGRGYIPVKVALEIHDIAHQAGYADGYKQGKFDAEVTAEYGEPEALQDKK